MKFKLILEQFGANLILLENIYEEITDDVSEDEEFDSNGDNEIDENKLKRQIVWLAKEYDRMYEILSKKIKEKSSYLSLFHKFNKAREIFRFMIKFYDTYSTDEILEIVEHLESILKVVNQKINTE